MFPSQEDYSRKSYVSTLKTSILTNLLFIIVTNYNTCSMNGTVGVNWIGNSRWCSVVVILLKSLDKHWSCITVGGLIQHIYK